MRPRPRPPPLPLRSMYRGSPLRRPFRRSRARPPWRVFHRCRVTHPEPRRNRRRLRRHRRNLRPRPRRGAPGPCSSNRCTPHRARTPNRFRNSSCTRRPYRCKCRGRSSSASDSRTRRSGRRAPASRSRSDTPPCHTWCPKAECTATDPWECRNRRTHPGPRTPDAPDGAPPRLPCRYRASPLDRMLRTVPCTPCRSTGRPRSGSTRTPPRNRTAFPAPVSRCTRPPSRTLPPNSLRPWCSRSRRWAPSTSKRSASNPAPAGVRKNHLPGMRRREWPRRPCTTRGGTPCSLRGRRTGSDSSRRIRRGRRSRRSRTAGVRPSAHPSTPCTSPRCRRGYTLRTAPCTPGHSKRRRSSSSSGTRRPCCTGHRASSRRCRFRRRIAGRRCTRIARRTRPRRNPQGNRPRYRAGTTPLRRKTRPRSHDCRSTTAECRPCRAPRRRRTDGSSRRTFRHKLRPRRCTAFYPRAARSPARTSRRGPEPRTSRIVPCSRCRSRRCPRTVRSRTRDPACTNRRAGVATCKGP